MKSFDPGLDTEAVYHHLTPQTYMRGWKHGNSSIYYIKKDGSNIDANDWSKSTANILGKENYFSRNIKSLFHGPEDFGVIFKPLENYKVVFKSLPLKSPDEMGKNYLNYNEWVITDGNFQEISDELKATLKLEIESIDIKNIEIGWARLYEDGWPILRQSVEKAIEANAGLNKFGNVRRKELIEFMVSMDWRSPRAHPDLVSLTDEIFSILEINEFMSESVPNESNPYNLVETEREHYIHELLMSAYYKFLNKTGPMYNEVEFIFKNMNIELLVAPEGFEFITSDIPVCKTLNNENKIDYVFPLTPKIACSIRKGNPYNADNFFVSYLDKEEVFYHNEKHRENCEELYILKENSLSPYFK